VSGNGIALAIGVIPAVIW